MAALAGNLIEQERVKTTLTKAKLARSMAEKLVTVARKGINSEAPEAKLAARRRAEALLMSSQRVAKLFDEIAPRYMERPGGYTRVTKLGRRASDSSEMAILEWMGSPPPENRQKKVKEAEKEG